MQWIIAFSVISAMLLVVDGSVNYCGAKMCGYTNDHTYCMYPIGPSHQCLGYMQAQLTPDEKDKIMARLNRRRNEAATGRIRGLPSAGDMVKLRWVEELAHEAQRWADRCEPPRTPERHDACRDLYSITVGQCVASVVGEAPGLRVETMVDVWYMQNLLYKGNLTSYEPPANNFSYYGDFGQLIWARTYMVGCGRSRFMSPWQGRLRTVERLVCNFSPRGPTIARPIWSPAVPTSLCPARSVPDIEYSSLCDFQHELDEASDIDNSMTLQEHVQLNMVLESERNKLFTYEGSLDDLYLNKVAIAMGDNETIFSHMDPMNKNNILKLNESKGDTGINKTLNNGPKPLQIKKKVNIIGRPKSYNLEELNIVSVEERIENNDYVKITEKDTYGEYEFLDVAEENYTTLMEPSTELPIEKSTIKVENETSSLGNVLTSTETTENIINLQFTSASFEISVNVNSEPMNCSTTEKHNVKDYLSDRETIAELQEALDSMENAAATTSESTPPAKVRRDLRENPSNMEPNILDQYSLTHGDVNPVEVLRSIEENSLTHLDKAPEKINNINNTFDGTPMMKMVMKYMPYIKQYQKGITGQSESKGGTLALSPYFILVLGIYL